MTARSSRARVALEPRRLWSLRVSLGFTRWVLYAVALLGVIATARNVISPPHERIAVAQAPRVFDASAQWFALSFARAYLTWSADPSLHQGALSPFLASADDPDGGLTPAGGSSEQVRWLAIAGARDGTGGEHDYTVAAGTVGGSVRYLAVAVAPGADGREVLARYPALVGAPIAARAGELDGPGLEQVTNSAVIGVLERALRNYVDSSAENLTADLATGAAVAPVAAGLSLREVVRLAVEPSGAVLASVLAADAQGDLFTLAYEVTLAQLGGRWEITRIQS
jgi:hypothetical protein